VWYTITMTKPPCLIEECANSSVARGLCSSHYKIGERDGWLTQYPILRKSRQEQECSVDGCTKVQFLRRGWCDAHYMRNRMHGSPTGGGPDKAPKGSGTLNRDGYRLISHNGKQVLEHRVVMAEHIGRPLTRDENVHHLDGDRTNNRLDNLELWSTSQPSGQRVADKIEWAQNFLARYASWGGGSSGGYSPLHGSSAGA
jgi:hypothetical protein